MDWTDRQYGSHGQHWTDWLDRTHWMDWAYGLDGTYGLDRTHG